MDTAKWSIIGEWPCGSCTVGRGLLLERVLNLLAVQICAIVISFCSLTTPLSFFRCCEAVVKLIFLIEDCQAQLCNEIQRIIGNSRGICKFLIDKPSFFVFSLVSPSRFCVRKGILK